MSNYQITINFTTDRPLSQNELDLILGACEVQVEEPVDFAGDDMDLIVQITESDLQETM